MTAASRKHARNNHNATQLVRVTEPVTRVVVCDYCGQNAQLVDSGFLYGGKSFGMVWWCCCRDAYVGVHKNSKDFAPMGRLADEELRAWRKRTHAIFDLLWKTPHRLSRQEAYLELQHALRLPKECAHVGMFDLYQCTQAVKYFETFVPCYMRTGSVVQARAAAENG